MLSCADDSEVGECSAVKEASSHSLEGGQVSGHGDGNKWCMQEEEEEEEEVEVCARFQKARLQPGPLASSLALGS